MNISYTEQGRRKKNRLITNPIDLFCIRCKLGEEVEIDILKLK